MTRPKSVTLEFTPEFLRALKKLKKKNIKLFKKIHSLLEIFRTDPFCPSLKTHKLKGKLVERYAFSVNQSMRIVFKWKNSSTALIWSLGTHDQVYK